MACAVEEILQDRITAGIVIVKYDHIESLKRIAIIEAGHPVPYTNGVADHTTIQRALALDLKPELFLEENNAYPFFDRISDLFKTGITHTNVMDLRIMLIR